MGTTVDKPLSLRGAVEATKPGSVVCLLAGTYYVSTPFEITRSGTESNWVVYRSYDGQAVIEPASGSYALLQVKNPVRYIEIDDLQFDGHDKASAGIDCKGCDHVRAIGNKISHTGRGGILSYIDWDTGKHPDYVTADHNLIFHCGYNQGGSSAISYNRHTWFDQYQGFHSFVTNNIISGEYDNSPEHSDGNGIIVDNPGGANTPPVLIANNIVYMNGGRCIHSLSGAGNWIVNNTCYQNGLDLAVKGGRNGNNGEIVLFKSAGDYVINNIAYAWGDRRPYSDEGPHPATYYSNLWYTSGTGENVVPSTAKNQLHHEDPRFVAPPRVDKLGVQQYLHAVPPDQLTGNFHLQPGSSAIGAGIDPTTILKISADVLSGLKAYVYKDIEGKPRPAGGPFDLGGYQSR